MTGMPWTKINGVGKMHGMDTAINVQKFVDKMVQIEQDKIDKENFGILSKKKAQAKKLNKKKKKTLPGLLGA